MLFFYSNTNGLRQFDTCLIKFWFIKFKLGFPNITLKITVIWILSPLTHVWSDCLLSYMAKFMECKFLSKPSGQSYILKSLDGPSYYSNPISSEDLNSRTENLLFECTHLQKFFFLLFKFDELLECTFIQLIMNVKTSSEST